MKELEEKIAVKYLGKTSMLLVVGVIVCFLASLGYSTYLKIQSTDKKIEVQSMNSNQTF